MNQPSWSFNQSFFESAELLKNTGHELPIEAAGAHTDQAGPLATENAEVAPFVTWNVQQTRLPDES